MRPILFVGLGGIGQRHLRNLRELVGYEPRVLAFRVRGERAVLDDQLQIIPGENLERRYRVEVFSDLEQALEQQPGIVFITNPSSRHMEVAEKAVARGCHLFIEKPLSHNLEGVEKLAEEIARRRLVTLVAYQMRFHPGFLRIQKLLKKNALGRVFFAQLHVGEYLPNFHRYEDYRRMYAARSELGGGVVLSQIHELDCTCAWFGLPQRVFSLGGQLSSLEIDVDDIASSLLEYRHDDGRVLPVQVHQDFVQRPTKRASVIVGEQGKVEWSLSERRLVLFGADGVTLEEHSYAELPRNAPYRAELEHFLECVASGHQTAVPFEAGAASLKLAVRLLESQASGRVLTIERGLNVAA